MARSIVILMCCLIWVTPCGALTAIKSVSVWPSKDTNSIVFETNELPKYKVYTLEKPNRIVIDFEACELKTKIDKVPLDGMPVSNIRTGIHGNKQLRIVLDVLKKIDPKVSLLARTPTRGPRLVIELPATTLSNKPKKSAAQQKFLVAIDAGHGGDDPGAIGPRGTREKDVVLGVAKYLKDMVNQQPGMQAILIRDRDVYIGLRERMRRARKQHAHLFISIHADAYKNKTADGASVFVLSSKRASSEAARWLAASENRADLVGGLSLDDKGDVLASVLLDLSKTASAKASLTAAQDILHSLGQTTTLHKKSVESAGFMVLRAPDMPAVLVETGFISNPKTEQRLRDKKYQQKIAAAIMQGVKKYYQRRTH